MLHKHFKIHSFQGESLTDTFWIPYGIWFQEFHEYRPRVIETPADGLNDYFKIGTFIKLLWTLATFLLMASFSGNLKSQLIIQNYGSIIKTLGELLEE